MFQSRDDGVNAWVTIMRGCDKFCTFVLFIQKAESVVGVLKGIVKEVKKAYSSGFSEITLLGRMLIPIIIMMKKFPNLLDAVKVDGLKRIRYTSPHPQDIDEDLLDYGKT